MESKRPRLYVAGPDVFRPNAVEHFTAMREICERYGFEPVIPLDGTETTSKQIAEGNFARLATVQCVAANLNPFRGSEPDSGTVAEAIIAARLHRIPVVGYMQDTRPMIDRLVDQGTAQQDDWGRIADRWGWTIENFGHPLNLMLAESFPVVQGQFLDAVVELSRRVQAGVVAGA